VEHEQPRQCVGELAGDEHPVAGGGGDRARERDRTPPRLINQRQLPALEIAAQPPVGALERPLDPGAGLVAELVPVGLERAVREPQRTGSKLANVEVTIGGTGSTETSSSSASSR